MAKSDNKETGKAAAFQTALDGIKKLYGQEAIIDMSGEKADSFKIDFFPTGCISLDRVLGGGIPRGRIIEIYGSPSSGKSVLATYLMAKFQQAGGKAVLLDLECAFSPDFAKKIGLNMEELQVSQPSSGEEAMDICMRLINSNTVDIIVVDSVSNLVPLAEIEKGVTEQTMAVQAKLLSTALRQMTGPISKSKTVLLFINQTRQKIGFFVGPSTTTSGGLALKFYSSIRVEVTKGKSITEGEDKTDNVVGNWIGINVKKNKVAPPFKTCEIELYYEKGIDIVGDLLDVALKDEILTRSGNTISYGEVKLGVGRDQAKKFLADEANKKIYQEIYKKVCQTK